MPSRDLGRDQGRQGNILADTIIARLERYGETFEILIKPTLVEAYLDDKLENREELFAVETIFKDAHKGDKASTENMEKAFETTDFHTIAKYIMKHGQIQLTTEKRREMQEIKRKKIINVIVKNSINPQTRTPHPPTRIEMALKEAGFHVDPFKSVDAQVREVLTVLQPIIPIRFEKVQIAVHVAGEDYGKLYGTLQTFGQIVKEEWQSNGSWIGIVEVPAGLQNDFFDAVNNKTKGDAELKLLE